MAESPQMQQLTFFLWPAGLFPRRVAFYLREKKLPPSTPIKIVTCNLNLTTGQLESEDASEPKPTGSVPCLRVGDQANGKYIRQATAILEYLEDVFGGVGVDMRGATAVERAWTRDLVNLIGEVHVNFNYFLIHASPAMAEFNGLKERSKGAARGALADMHRQLGILERWVGENLLSKGTWLNGFGQGPSIADCTLVALVEYAREMYGVDVLEGHEALKAWYEKYKAHPSFEGDPPVPVELREKASVLDY